MRNVDVVTRLQLEGVIISTSTLSKIERGYTNPTVETLIALTDIFKCDFNAFFQQVQEEQYFCLGGITIKGTYSHKLKGMWYDVESLL